MAAVEVHHDAADVTLDARAVRAALLAVARSRHRPTARRTRGSPAPRDRAEKPANASRTRSVAPDHDDRVGAADRREEIPPRQPAVVAEQPRLRAQVPAERRQRRDDRVGHRVERRAIDVVRAQCGLEIVGETAPAVQHAELALGAVERGRERHRHRLPRLELALVRGARRRAARDGSRARARTPSAPARARRPARAARPVSCDETSPWSRCHASDPDGASSPASDSSCSVIWSSAPSAALRNANACSAASGLRAMSVSTSSAASHAPSRLPSGASGAARVWSSTWREAARSSRLSVRDQRVEIRRDRPELRLQLVGRVQHRLERGHVGVGRRARGAVARMSSSS